MLNWFVSHAARRYFCWQILSDGGKDPEVFAILAKFYGLNENEAESLYARANTDALCAIRSRESFNFYMRMNELDILCGNVGESDAEMLCEKDAALTALERLGIVGNFGSHEIKLEQLRLKASKNIIEAMFLLGMLGAIKKSNNGKWKDMLQRAEKWNCTEAAMLLAATESDPTPHLAVLKSCLNVTAYGDVYGQFIQRLGISKPEKIESSWENDLLESLFRNGYHRELYDGSAKRILYTDVLGRSTRRQVLYSRDRALFAALNDLPLTDRSALRRKTATNPPFGRERSWEKLRHAANGANRSVPILTCSDPWVLRCYREALAHSEGVTPPVLDLAVISAGDLAPSIMNVLAGICKQAERADSLLFLVNADQLRIDCREKLMRFLDADKRAHYPVHTGGLEANFGGFRPIVFSSKRPFFADDPSFTVINEPPLTDTERKKECALLLKNFARRTLLTPDARAFFNSIAPERLFIALSTLSQETETIDLAVAKDAVNVSEDTRRIGF